MEECMRMDKAYFVTACKCEWKTMGLVGVYNVKLAKAALCMK